MGVAQMCCDEAAEAAAVARNQNLPCHAPEHSITTMTRRW